ncbi:hypothetical protein [Pedobacter sp. G11]|uniref:ComEA family DNA-binding protein n=1 Tax=Pedobacter sp. G11 TaxID=2482728 RepID=UPI0011CFA5F8|nr:hypothetical protein [Pedobacter sp. G11]
MIRIRYPKDPEKPDAFQDNYFEKLSEAFDNLSLIEKDLEKVKTIAGTKLTFKNLVTAPFVELSSLSADLNALSKAARKRLGKLIDYSRLQPTIADFFMQEMSSELHSCFYCNIDTIYAFTEIGAYSDTIQFINQADSKELQLVNHIGPVTAAAIIAKRKVHPISSLDELNLRPQVIDAIKTAHQTPTHNHFTLDHFFHQQAHPFLCLSLFNFVPCCYACNSKFKGTKKLYSTSSSLSSPSSSDYKFADDVRFKLFFKVEKDEVKTADDFTVDLVTERNVLDHQEFISVLKLRGRYVHHKKEALKLLLLKQKYPDSALEQLSAVTGLPVDQIKRDLFGADLFEAAFDHAGLVKYRRDIAQGIDVRGVRET